MVAHQRSGTTVIRATLQVHEAITDCGECFNLEGAKYVHNFFHFLRLDDNRRLLYPGNSRLRFLQFYDYLATISEKPIGLIDAKYDALRLFDPESHEFGAPPALLSLLNDIGGAVIHLTRNPFHIYVSHQVAVQRGMWHITAGTPSICDPGSLLIDIADLLWYVTRRCRERTAVDEYLAECHETLTLDYDEVTTLSGGLKLDAIWSFLGLTPRVISPPLGRTITEPYSSLIRNYEEVVHALTTNGYASMLGAAKE